MTIAAIREKCKAALERIPRDALVVGVLITASSASFGLGYLTGQGSAGGAVAIEVAPGVSREARDRAAVADGAGAPSARGFGGAEGTYVASKNGTKYYLPTCAGAKRINEENKVWFATVVEAQAAGYAPAANCKGL